MGFFERVFNDLFLPDGVFSLWSLDSGVHKETGKLPGTNLYGAHPFYMAKATDDSWFGVYTNLAAAQDWWIKTNQTVNREVDIKNYAAGGVGDLYFFTDDNPNLLT
jgi:hypothetical protein